MFKLLLMRALYASYSFVGLRFEDQLAEQQAQIKIDTPAKLWTAKSDRERRKIYVW